MTTAPAVHPVLASLPTPIARGHQVAPRQAVEIELPHLHAMTALLLKHGPQGLSPAALREAGPGVAAVATHWELTDGQGRLRPDRIDTLVHWQRAAFGEAERGLPPSDPPRSATARAFIRSALPALAAAATVMVQRGLAPAAAERLTNLPLGALAALFDEHGRWHSDNLRVAEAMQGLDPDETNRFVAHAIALRTHLGPLHPTAPQEQRMEVTTLPASPPTPTLVEQPPAARVDAPAPVRRPVIKRSERTAQRMRSIVMAYELLRGAGGQKPQTFEEVAPKINLSVERLRTYLHSNPIALRMNSYGDVVVKTAMGTDQQEAVMSMPRKLLEADLSILIKLLRSRFAQAASELMPLGQAAGQVRLSSSARTLLITEDGQLSKAGLLQLVPGEAALLRRAAGGETVPTFVPRSGLDAAVALSTTAPAPRIPRPSAHASSLSMMRNILHAYGRLTGADGQKPAGIDEAAFSIKLAPSALRNILSEDPIALRVNRAGNDIVHASQETGEHAAVMRIPRTLIEKDRERLVELLSRRAGMSANVLQPLNEALAMAKVSGYAQKLLITDEGQLSAEGLQRLVPAEAAFLCAAEQGVRTSFKAMRKSLSTLKPAELPPGPTHPMPLNQDAPAVANPPETAGPASSPRPSISSPPLALIGASRRSPPALESPGPSAKRIKTEGSYEAWPSAKPPTVLTEIELDQARSALVEAEMLDSCDLSGIGWDLNLDINKVVALEHHAMEPVAAHENEFPLRDPKDPTRAYAPYIGADGQCHANVKVLGASIATGMPEYMRKLSPQLTGGMTRAEFKQACVAITADIKREVQRLIHNEPTDKPRHETRQIISEDVPDEHEQMLVKEYGLFALLPKDGSDKPPTFKNGRILGLFNGAVIETPEDKALHEARFGGLEDYAIDLEPPTDTSFKFISTKGHTNSMAFANTALKPKSVLNPKAKQLYYEHEKINALLMNVNVDLIDKNLQPRTEKMVAIVALENLLDPVVSPNAQVRVNYGDNYLKGLRRRLQEKRRAEQSAALLPVKAEPSHASDVPVQDP